MNDMGIGTLLDLAGDWELAVDLPAPKHVRGHVRIETLGEVRMLRTTRPVPEEPDSCCVIVGSKCYVHNYFYRAAFYAAPRHDFRRPHPNLGAHQAGLLAAGLPPAAGLPVDLHASAPLGNDAL